MKENPEPQVITGSGRCRSCNAEILWTVTKHGKSMPLHPKANYLGVHRPHFNDCPDAKTWRKRASKKVVEAE